MENILESICKTCKEIDKQAAPDALPEVKTTEQQTLDRTDAPVEDTPDESEAENKE